MTPIRKNRPYLLKSLAVLMACAVVATAHASAAADPAPKSNFTPAQREELKHLFHDYLISNPEVISEAVVALQAKEEADKTASQKSVIAAKRKELIQPAENTVIGNPKGDVTLVEFFDYNCGYCKAMFPAMMETLKEDGKVRIKTHGLKSETCLAETKDVEAALGKVRKREKTREAFEKAPATNRIKSR